MHLVHPIGLELSQDLGFTVITALESLGLLLGTGSLLDFGCSAERNVAWGMIL